MASANVIEVINVIFDRCFSLQPSPESCPPDHLCLQGFKECLHGRVVVTRLSAPSEAKILGEADHVPHVILGSLYEAVEASFEHRHAVLTSDQHVYAL